MCLKNSSRKFSIIDRKGIGTACPKPQNDVSSIVSARLSRRSKSLSFPLPLEIESKIDTANRVPSRQGVHFPHDSCSKNSIATFAASTAQVSVSIARMTPEPIETPSFPESKSNLTFS